MNDQPSLEYRLARLLADYLIHAREQGALPETLNIGIGLDIAARQRPCVVCHIDSLEFPHSRLVEATALMLLHTHADETAVLEEATWIGALRRWLCDSSNMAAWLGALPQSERTGWDIRRLRITRSETEINREDRTRTHTTRFTVSAMADELTPLA